MLSPFMLLFERNMLYNSFLDISNVYIIYPDRFQSLPGVIIFSGDISTWCLYKLKWKKIKMITPLTPVTETSLDEYTYVTIDDKL